MSEMKHYVGKLKEVYPGSKETFEEMCHRILLEENVVGTDEIVEDYYYSEWSNVLQENLYDNTCSWWCRAINKGYITEKRDEMSK